MIEKFGLEDIIDDRLAWPAALFVSSIKVVGRYVET